MKKTALLIFFFASISQSKAQDNVIIEGTADTKYNGEHICIYTSTLHVNVRDSAIITNGKFTFTKPFIGPTRYMFYSGYEVRTKRRFPPWGILIDHSSLARVTADMNNFSNSKTKGSEAQAVFESYVNKIDPIEKSMMEMLFTKYSEEFVENRHPDTSTAKYKSFQKEYDSLSVEKGKKSVEIGEAIIKLNPSSFGAMALLDRIYRDLDLAKLEQLYGSLSPKYKQGVYAKGIETNIDGKKNHLWVV
jgi:hypothetical protein